MSPTLNGITSEGTSVPVQVTEEGKLLAVGQEGQQGPPGEAGPPGPAGQDGEPGKDGSDGLWWKEVNSRLITTTDNKGILVPLDGQFGGNVTTTGVTTESVTFPDGSVLTSAESAGGGGMLAYVRTADNYGAIAAVQNIERVTRTATGLFNVYFSEDLGNAFYVPLCTCIGSRYLVYPGEVTSGFFQVVCEDLSTGQYVDTKFGVAVFGASVSTWIHPTRTPRQ